MVNFGIALTHHFCLVLYAAFTEPGHHLLAEPFLSTGFSSEIGTKLRDWAVGQAGGSCYSRAALSSNDSKTLYIQRKTPLLLCPNLGPYSISTIQEVSELQSFPFCISGNSLPQDLYYAATVNHEESFMIYGGSDGPLHHFNKIYRYNMDNGQWVEEAATISEAKEAVTAIRVKQSLFKACPSGKPIIIKILQYRNRRESKHC